MARDPSQIVAVHRSAEIRRGWMQDGRRVAVALLVEVEGSAPLPPGASMVIDENGSIDGSITGGCVEGAVVEQARAVLSGQPPRVVTYGISDELAGTVGLSCGGIVHIFVHELDSAATEAETAVLDAVLDGRPAAIATLLDGEHAGSKLAVVDGKSIASLGVTPLMDHNVGRELASLVTQPTSMIRRYGSDGATLGSDLRVHIRCFAPPPEMVIFGAIDFSASLARLAKELGYRVTICDPRAPFVRTPRFEEEATVVVAWPQDALGDRDLGTRDAVLVFTHDPKLDEPALMVGLGTDAGYIGALGSRRTIAERNRRLRGSGVTDEQLARIHAPCGLDIGSSTPEEVAISVLAEIIAARSARSGASLKDTSGSIHGSELPTTVYSDRGLGR